MGVKAHHVDRPWPLQSARLASASDRSAASPSRFDASLHKRSAVNHTDLAAGSNSQFYLIARSRGGDLGPRRGLASDVNRQRAGKRVVVGGVGDH